MIECVPWGGGLYSLFGVNRFFANHNKESGIFLSGILAFPFKASIILMIYLFRVIFLVSRRIGTIKTQANIFALQSNPIHWYAIIATQMIG